MANCSVRRSEMRYMNSQWGPYVKFYVLAISLTIASLHRIISQKRIKTLFFFLSHLLIKYHTCLRSLWTVHSTNRRGSSKQIVFKLFPGRGKLKYDHIHELDVYHEL